MDKGIVMKPSTLGDILYLLSTETVRSRSFTKLRLKSEDLSVIISSSTRKVVKEANWKFHFFRTRVIFATNQVDN